MHISLGISIRATSIYSYTFPRAIKTTFALAHTNQQELKPLTTASIFPFSLYCQNNTENLGQKEEIFPEDCLSTVVDNKHAAFTGYSPTH